MKKLLLTSIIFLLGILSIQSQTYRYIPDLNFRNYLRITLALPFNISGDSLNISAPAVTSLTTMTCSSRSISNITGISYFTSLNYLDCSYNNISTLPTFPSSLRTLLCSHNGITSLSGLTVNLTKLDCSNNAFSTITSLPSTLEILNCKQNGAITILSFPVGLKELYIGNDFTPFTIPTLPLSLEIFDCTLSAMATLPTLPAGLIKLYCGNNPITSLPSLPLTLETLVVSNCGALTSLGTLPSSLLNLSCTDCNLTSLGVLPSSLQFIACQRNNLTSLTLPPNLITLNSFNNSLTSISSFPNSLMTCNLDHNPLTTIPPLGNQLIEFTIGYTHISSIPELPNTLRRFFCNNDSFLTCLPYLPSSLNLINYSNCIALHCMPNFVSGASYTPAFSALPLCNPYIHSCPSYTGFAGNIYTDSNSNCLLDTNEARIKNINIILKNGTTTLGSVSSDNEGSYAFDTLSNSMYTMLIDTNNIPFNVTCPISGYYNVLIDSTHRFVDNINFALECLPGFDIATFGLYPNYNIRPISSTTFNFNGGDISNLFGVHCTSINGSIAINYSGNLIFSGVQSGTLSPDSILPNRIVWNIANFSTLDFFNSIKPIFTTDSTAIVGDLICFTSEIYPTLLDRNPINNTFNQCFTISAALDPNYKEVSPSGTITSAQDWLYFKINFQNIGTSYAENIYVWDTIDPNLNLNTIQVLGASHNKFMKVYPTTRAVKFQFDDINLPDSTSDEPNSHGWVQYRIKLNPGLPEGTLIHNKAGILFDLNAPIITNTTETKICNTTVEIDQTITIPFGGSAHVGTHTYSNAGVFTDLLLNVNGCDSLVNTTIIEATCSPIASSSQSITINEGQSYTIGSNTYTVAGTYIDTIPTTDGNCDSLAITTNLTVINGIENLGNINLAIYPNPTKNLVTIDLIGIAKAPIQIFDMYGNLIYSNTEIKNKIIIDTENWSNGTYIIQYNHQHVKLMVSH